MIVNFQFVHTFIVFKNLWKELITGINMHLLHWLVCDWTDNGYMFLHEDKKVLNHSLDAGTKLTHLKTISNIDTC